MNFFHKPRVLARKRRLDRRRAERAARGTAALAGVPVTTAKMSHAEVRTIFFGLMLAGVPSGTGAELVLEQQAYMLGKMNLPEAERASRIELQKRIQAAVLGEGTWDDIPEALKRQAETPWFESFLRFSPAPLMSRVRQPLLVLQGSLDRQVPPHHG